MSVPIYRSTNIKGGKQYVSFTVHAYGADGKRQRWSYADLDKAKAKAGTLADAMAKRQADAENRSHPLFLEAVEALNIVYNAGGFSNLLIPVRLLAEALKLVGKDQLLLACQAWADRKPGATFIPKKVAEAVDEFLARQKGQISERRHRTNTSYLNTFKAMFENCDVHSVNALELSDKVDSKEWGKRTKNDFLGTLSLFYLDAIQRNYSAINPAGPKAIKRARLSSGSVHIFTVEEGRKLMNSVSAGLEPFLALWMFSGCRKDEVARVTWEQIGQGLEAGSIYLLDDQTKNGVARAIPICDSLRAWLMAFRKPAGLVLPADWRGGTEKDQMQKLDELQRYLAAC